MQITTKYEIGEHIWFIYKNRGEVCIYDDYIVEITVDKDGIIYICKDVCEEIREEDIILYNDTINLGKRIQEIIEKMREEEIK